MKLTLTDQGGNLIGRFGAAGVKRVLMNPTRCKYDDKHNDYALVWCEAADSFIMREGYGRNYVIRLIYWDNDEDVSPKEEEFPPGERDKAIAKFLRICKQKG